MKKWKKLIGWLIGIAIILVIGGVFYQSYQLGFNAFSNESQSKKEELEVTVEIPDGAGQQNVAELLCEKGLLDSTMPFLLRYNLSEYRGKIQPGTYELNGKMGIDDILVVLTNTEK